jgi:predicted dehydrogenase
MLGAAGAAAAVTFAGRNVLGANETINLGVIGMGGRGGECAKWFSAIDGVRIAAVCDPDKTRIATVQKAFPAARGMTDMRRMLDDKGVDAVVICSSNHWHALAAIWACQAGKDVYVEKPVSQTVWEGRRIVEAARKYNRVVQGGTQQRSDRCQPAIREFIQSGKLGRMQWIRGNRLGRRESIGRVDSPLQPPASVDYNMWLGPAQDLPMYRKNFHYDWHWIWNTGSGEMGNWGVHILDDIRNMLFDKCTLPLRVAAGGGRVAWDDGGETPNVHIVYFDTGIVPVIFSLSNLPLKTGVRSEPHFRGIRSGFVIQFEDGYYAGGRNGGWAYDNDGKRIQQFAGDGGGAHARNFINAMRSRDISTLNADIEENHYTAAWCHLANIAFRLGAPHSNQKAKDLASFKPWQDLVDEYEGYCTANDVDLARANLKLSTFLEIDPKKETFTGPSATPEALALLTREYRKGFEVPANV